MPNQDLIDDFFKAVVGITTVIAAYQAWRAKQTTKSTRTALNSMIKRHDHNGTCLNAVHCECCPEYHP